MSEEAIVNDVITPDDPDGEDVRGLESSGPTSTSLLLRWNSPAKQDAIKYLVRVVAFISLPTIINSTASSIYIT